MNLSTWSIQHPIPALLLFALLTLAGALGFQQMTVQNMPDIDLPVVNVLAALPGAAPAQLENDVARKLENAIAGVQGIKNIFTTLRDGSVTIGVAFRIEKDVQQAVDEVRDAVARVRADLPAALRDPVVTKVDLAGAPILSYTVEAAHLDAEALSWFVDGTVAKRLLAVRGVGAVQRVGGVSRELRVELDPGRLLALGVSAADISRQLQQVQQDASGGRAGVGGAEQSVRTLAGVASADDMARLEIPLPNDSLGRHLRLDQLASVTDTVAERRSAALLNGRQVVGFEITRSRGAGELAVAAAVQQALEDLRAAHPQLRITEAFNAVEPVRENFRGSMLMLYEGAALAVLVVWLFLRDWRATLVSATALPLSAIPTFAVMQLMGFTLNGVTLLSLSLVVGILVDDAIVEIENIMRHLRQGKSPLKAAREAANEIGLAVIATTFTLVAVFLPTAFMSGVVGRFFVQFGWTAAVAVLFSLLVARLLTPMMAAHLLRPLPKQAAEPGWVKLYLKAAAWCLRHRLLTLAAVLVFLGASGATVLVLPTGFMPPDELAQTQVTVTLPPGSTLAQTEALAEEARLAVMQDPQVKLVYTTIGGGRAGGDPFAPPGAVDVTIATLNIQLSPRGARPDRSKQAIEAGMRERLAVLPGARVQVGMGGAGNKYMLRLSGEDGELLAAHAAKVERELRGLPGIGMVLSSSSLQRPELIVRPDFASAAELGVTASAIADTLRVATAGDYEPALAKLNLPQRQLPVVVRLPAWARDDLSLLAQLPVPGSRGPVALGQVAELSLAGGLTQIDRHDRQRNVNFEIELNAQSLGQVERAVLALPSLRALPPGVSHASLGDAEAMAELFTGFAIAMLAGVLCIYVVLVLLFHDFMQPVTILVALVMCVPGAFLALAAAGSSISMPSMIGLIMLMGIATKNSILLVDYVILAQRDLKLARADALLDACHKRARPIVMTTVAMAAGMLPVALGIGADPSFRAPMAIVVIGGLISSTVLSLLVVPVVYTCVDDVVQAALRRLPPRQVTDLTELEIHDPWRSR